MMAGRVPAAKRGAGGLNRTDLWEAARKRLARESDHRRVAADDPELRPDFLRHISVEVDRLAQQDGAEGAHAGGSDDLAAGRKGGSDDLAAGRRSVGARRVYY